MSAEKKSQKDLDSFEMGFPPKISICQITQTCMKYKVATSIGFLSDRHHGKSVPLGQRNGETGEEKHVA